MSETRHGGAAPHGALAHTGEVAQWVLLLLGWMWLGEQGMRLGWSLASGVLAVSLWWAARLLFRGSDWALNARPWVMAVCGGLSALGVWLPQALRSVDAHDLNWPHAGLLAVALLWGTWSGMVETRSRTSTFDLGPVAWHPVLAAVGVGWVAGAGWAGWSSVSAAFSTAAVSALLLTCAAVLQARDHAMIDAPRACRGQRGNLHHVLAPSTMGLMMGGLWLGNVWCAGWGWTTQEMVLWHLAMMAGLPALVALVGHVAAHCSNPLKPTFAPPPNGSALPSSEIFSTIPAGVLHSLLTYANEHHPTASTTHASRPQREAFRLHLSLALLALGALMLLGQSALHGLLAMLLPSVAWALHCSRSRSTFDRSTPAEAGWKRALSLALGPGLLLWVGVTSPVLGPLAMQSAMAVLGSLAALQLVLMSTRPAVASPSWSTP